MVDYFILVYKHITCLTYPWEQLKLLISMLRSHKVVRLFLFKLGRQNWSIIQWQVERPAKKNIYFTLYLSTSESWRQWYQVKGFISLNSLFLLSFSLKVEQPRIWKRSSIWSHLLMFLATQDIKGLHHFPFVCQTGVRWSIVHIENNLLLENYIQVFSDM